MPRMSRRTMIALGAAVAGSTSAGAAWAAGNAGAPVPARAATVVDPMSLVHPELRKSADEMVAMVANFPPVSAATLAQSRRAMAGWTQPRLADVPVTRHTVPGRGLVPDVDVYVVNSKPGAARPATLNTHGGGYVLGSADGDVRNLQEIALALDCTCVSVDYAPEARCRSSRASRVCRRPSSAWARWICS